MHALIHHSHADGSPYPAEECPIIGSVKRETPLHVDDDVFWRKDGQSLPVEYVACPLVENGRVDGIVVAFTDVTERRRLDRMKDEFIATVSHELRTPLTSLRAALGLVASGALEKRPEKIPQMLDIALGNCDRLVRLVNDIVDFERIGSGSLPLHKSEWNVIDLLRRAMDPERSSAARAGLTFRIDAQPVDVWVDGDRILQVLGNLIRNAIKFSEKGGEIRLAARASSDKEVTFEVQDHGAGIPAEKLDLIFERFQQADASDSRCAGGTGLGLALCRGIVNQHGGRIWATSNPGSGSTFYFHGGEVYSSRMRTEAGGGNGRAASTTVHIRSEDDIRSRTAVSPFAFDAGGDEQQVSLADCTSIRGPDKTHSRSTERYPR